MLLDDNKGIPVLILEENKKEIINPFIIKDIFYCENKKKLSNNRTFYGRKITTPGVIKNKKIRVFKKQNKYFLGYESTPKTGIKELKSLPYSCNLVVDKANKWAKLTGPKSLNSNKWVKFS